MFKLPPFDVVVWHRVDSSAPGLHDAIITRAGRQPDESTEWQGFRDLHWGFETAQAATAFAESLFDVVGSEDIVLLSVLASYDETFRRRVYKDTRATMHHSA